MKIAEYKTATGSTVPELDAEVNKLIAKGFEPSGQQYFETWDIPSHADTHGFFQVMVRKGD